MVRSIATSALSRCLKEEATAISVAADRLDPHQVEQALNILEVCADKGAKLVITGVGKSGIVARKIAATFSSVGLMALYLNPLDALHGDLGVVAASDVVMLLSNSGETDELLTILPHLKRRGTRQIALVGRVQSSLSRECDVVIETSVVREACPLNLAPTASTAVAMAVGDALAAVWMERRGISPTDFALNHPAGSLGKQLTLTVADLMIPADKLHPLPPTASLSQVITQITRDGVGTCWIHPEEKVDQLAGIITDGDLRRALESYIPDQWSNLCAANLMTTNPITLPPGALAVDALTLMERNPKKAISVMPILFQDPDAPSQKLVAGLIRLHDLVLAGLA